MMQTVIVDVVVVVAALYATWRLLPVAARRGLAGMLAAALRRHGVAEARVHRLEKRAGSSACGACESCSGCAPGPKPSGTVQRVTVPGER